MMSGVFTVLAVIVLISGSTVALSYVDGLPAGYLDEGAKMCTAWPNGYQHNSTSLTAVLSS